MEYERLRNYLDAKKTVWEIALLENRSKNTIKNWMKKFSIKYPKGFFSRGLKIGRKKGFKMSEEQKQLRAKMFSGKGNPFYGWRHTKETRERMSKNHADFTGDKNPFKKSLEDPEKHAKFVAAVNARWAGRSKAWMRSFSEKLSKSIANSQRFQDPKQHIRHDAGFVDTEKSGKVFCRSSWEKKVCKYLDDNDYVDSFLLEPFCVSYIDSAGLSRHTRVDFVVKLSNGRSAMLEVKPNGLHKHCRLKIEAYRKHCRKNKMSFSLIGEKEIASQEVFDRKLDKIVRR